MSRLFSILAQAFGNTANPRSKNREAKLRLENLEPRQMLATVAVQSGSWHDFSTWDNGIPTATERAIISQGTTVTMDGIDHIAEEIVVHGVLDVAEDVNGITRTLTANWIHVNSGGAFQIGTETDRYDTSQFVVTLTGTDILADHVIETVTGTMNVDDNDGFLMTASGGSLQFFGDQKLSFTKLASTAEANSATITVENVIERNFDGTTSATSDGQLDWQVGDQIVIASSSYDYNDEEVRTITGITNNGSTSTLTLDSPLQQRHYGLVESYGNGTRTWDIDMRAEVAVLNRSITIQGTQDTDNQFGDRANYGEASGQNLGIGGHTMIMPNSGPITIDAVRFDRMGQTAQLGRYPVHWHIAGDRTGDAIRNSSVTNSNNRGITIHGTQGVVLEGNVLHDIHGHGYFMEDAAETGNQFLNNIAFGIHRVGGGTGGVLTSNDPFVVPGITRGPDGKVNGLAPQSNNGEGSHDTGQNIPNRFRHSAAYWITNPDNTWVGNISAGSEGSGFWFALPSRVLGLSLDTGLYAGVDPQKTNLLQFDHNTSHSTPVGLTFDRGSDIRGGGGNFFAPPQKMEINYYTAYKHIGTASYHRAGGGIFNESRHADNTTSSFNTFSQDERNVLFVGHSQGNADLQTKVGGFRLYDGPGHIVDSHFAGFAAENAHTFVVEGGANKHSLTDAIGISFEADGTADHLSIDHLNQPAWTVNNSPEFMATRPDAISGLVLDLDGSLTSHAGGGAGSVLTPKLDYYRDSNDIAPANWNAYISNDRYAQFKIGVVSNDNLALQHQTNDPNAYIPSFRIENGDGHAIVADRWNLKYVQRMYTKLNAGDYTIDFENQLPEDDFDIMLQIRRHQQTGDATVFRFVDAGRNFTPEAGAEVLSLTALRSASQTSFLRDLNGDLWIKLFATGNSGPSTVTIPIKQTPPIIVSNSNDSGAGSLREAILSANANPGLDTIAFAIEGGGNIQAIFPLSPLPSITDRVIFDGNSQSVTMVPDGSFENPVMADKTFELATGAGQGSLVGSQWLFAGGAGITRNLSGMQTSGTPAPYGKQHALIQGNGFFTQQLSGLEVGREYELSFVTMARQFGGLGNDLEVRLDAGQGSEIVIVDIPEVTFSRFTEVVSSRFTATKPDHTLTFSATRDGGNLTGDRTTFVDQTRLHMLDFNGVVLDGLFAGVAAGLDFGATSQIQGITINHFANGPGLRLTANGNIVDKVWSGVNSLATIAAANQHGLAIESNNNTIRNSILSGNSEEGIQVVSANNNVIAFNRVGVGLDSEVAIGNGGDGLRIDEAQGNTTAFNLIQNNLGNGVAIVGNTSLSNFVRVNSIADNNLLAIDLGDDGVTNNDSLDSDSGPNNLSNYPLLFDATTSGLRKTQIRGGMIGVPNSVYTIDFYASQNTNASGHGGGEQFITATTVKTGATGRAKFAITAFIERGLFVSATATDPSNNTSEFSFSVEAKPLDPRERSSRTVQTPTELDRNILQANQLSKFSGESTNITTIREDEPKQDKSLAIVDPVTPNEPAKQNRLRIVSSPADASQKSYNRLNRGQLTLNDKATDAGFAALSESDFITF